MKYQIEIDKDLIGMLPEKDRPAFIAQEVRDYVLAHFENIPPEDWASTLEFSVEIKEPSLPL